MSTRNRKVGVLLPGLTSRKKEKMWVSPGKLRNALMDNHMADFLEISSREGKGPTEKPFLKFLFEQGDLFRTAVMNFISQNIYPVLNLNGDFRKKPSDLRELMQRGVPIIGCVPLRNHYAAVRGVADLLVRSDYVNKIVPFSYSKEEEEKKASKLNYCDYHYVVIEIKFSTIHLNNTMEVTESAHITYLSQAYIYSRALYHIQGYMAPAFILGRKYHAAAGCGTTRDLGGPLSFLGRVRVSDNIVERTKEAAKWVRQVHREVQRGNAAFFSRIQPNMCASKDEETKKIAKERCELTLISSVGVKERTSAFERGVTNYMDPACNASLMGIRNTERAKMVDAIIDVNRSIEKLYRFDEKLRTTFVDLYFKEKKNIFLDFEIISDLFCKFDKFPQIQSSSFIFLAGILSNDKYTPIAIDELSLEAERRLLIKLVETLNSFGRNAIVWYWYAEKGFLKSALDRHPDLQVSILPDMVDLHAVLKANCFAVKGCFTYGLKDMTKAMSEMKLIECTVDTDCQDGMTASVNAWKYYTGGKRERDIFADIERYNYFDCYAMERILDFLKKEFIHDIPTKI